MDTLSLCLLARATLCARQGRAEIALMYLRTLRACYGPAPF